MKLVWLVDPKSMFECEWIEFFFQDVSHDTIVDITHDCVYDDAVFVFNHTFDYESYLANHYEERIRFGVIHLSDETLSDTCHYLDTYCCVFAIRNYYHPLYSRHPKVLTIGLGCKAGFLSLSPERHIWPWYHWCFAGAMHHLQRQQCILAFKDISPYFLVTSQKFNQTEMSIEQYRRMLEISKFALCPIGQGNLDTFRIYEAMEAGCIPVTLSHTEYQNYAPSYWNVLFNQDDVPFIIGASWDECQTKVNAILQSPIMFEDLRIKMNMFWTNLKNKWKTEIEKHVTTLMEADSQ